MSSDTLRLFLGIKIPEILKAKVNHLVRPLKSSSKGWENPEDYHITLLFIGEVEAEKLLQVKELLDGITFNSFTITIGGFHFFNRRIFYYGVETSDELKRLKEKVDSAFHQWAILETKEFVPHITLKRWQRYEFDELERRVQLNETSRDSYLVTELCLFQSKKDEFGKKYHVIHEAQAQESAAPEKS